MLNESGVWNTPANKKLKKENKKTEISRAEWVKKSVTRRMYRRYTWTQGLEKKIGN